MRLKKRKLGIAVTVLIVLIALWTVSPLLAQGEQAASVDVIIGVTSAGELDEIGVLVTTHSGRMIERWAFISAARAILPPQAIEAIQKNPKVVYVEATGTVYALKGPPSSPPGQDKKAPPQPPQEIPWGVDRIDADLAWTYSTGTGVKVAVLDTGIDYSHPDLDDNVMGGVSVLGPRTSTNPRDWKDKNGHGTHVAGTIGAENNDIGVVGVAPETYLYAVKVLNNAGTGSYADVIDGIEWSINNDIQVISMSFGGSSYSQALEDACKAAYDAGLVLVAAAGNTGDGNTDTDEVVYPAAYSFVIAVGATDQSDIAPYWSSSGPEVELAAPGVDVKSTYLDGGYETLSGTSMACPHVSGTAALVLASTMDSDYDFDGDGVWDNDEVRGKLQDTADDLGPSNTYGWGLVDAGEASGAEASA